ncbi:MAG: hypothetical protein GC145_17690 [Caulobacter sp.]|nr:hypothetical protein [Caulobacter sp.]
MRAVFLTPQAQDDLLEKIDWLLERSPEAAGRAEATIRASMAIVAEFPEIAQASIPEHRDCIVRFGKYGFVLRYRLYRGDILITRVFHGSQDR